MRIGYACIALGVPDTNMQKCFLSNAGEKRLREIIEHNLRALELLVEYNIKNNIFLFRISSDLIPFGSSPVNSLPWWDIYADVFQKIGMRMRQSGMRVSMHPGQYTVLNSKSAETADKAVADLRYHARVLDALQLDSVHKIILHVGGVYGEKNAAMACFEARYATLEPSIKKRLVLENDDRSYTVADVLALGHRNRIPVVFDNLHHLLNAPAEKRSDAEWIAACGETWGQSDGPQKIHYSQQAPQERAGHHSSTIRIQEFMVFYEKLTRRDLDIMLEVKDKNLSAIKCLRCVAESVDIPRLEREWDRYKYLVLERSSKQYQAIENLLQDKQHDAPLAFYELLENGLQAPATLGSFLNGAQHVWESCKKAATPQEQAAFQHAVHQVESSALSMRALKNRLYRLAVKYQITNLLDSYYFMM